MPEKLTDADLREAAQRRGYRLLKSRIKTPGKGDFGKFGLVDAKGAAVLGKGEKGFTASAEDIASFLRKEESSAWAASMTSGAGERPKSTRPKNVSSDIPDSVRVKKPRHAPAMKPQRKTRESSGRSTDHAEPKDRSEDRPAAPAAKPPKPVPPPVVVRAGQKKDVGAIAELLALIPGDTSATAIGALIASRRGSGVFVADRAGVIGVIGWTVFPTLQRGLVGRITAIVVAEDARRDGVATQLLDAALDRIGKEGAAYIEAISDIEIRNNHGFFRALGFEQTSYRFLRAISEKPGGSD